MATIPQPSLFSWQHIDTASDLHRLQLVLSALPDEPLVRFLEERRGRGRDDYPVRAMWNALIAGIVFQHPSAAALIRELWRNAELRQLCGFDPLRGMGAVPTDDAFGRFLELCVEHRDQLEQMFHRLVEELSHELPELGWRLAVDAKGIRSAGRPVKDEHKQCEPDGRRAFRPARVLWTLRGGGRNSPRWPARRPSGRRPTIDAPPSSASTRGWTGCWGSRSTSFAAEPRWRHGSRWRSWSCWPWRWGASAPTRPSSCGL